MAVMIDGDLQPGSARYEIYNFYVNPDAPHAGESDTGPGTFSYYASLSGLGMQTGLSPDEFFDHAEEYPELWKLTAKYLAFALYDLAWIF